MALPVVGVVGAGTMGAGIAAVAALAGHEVRLYDADPAGTAAGLVTISKAVASNERRGHITGAEASAARERVRPATSLDDLADAGLVIEAIVESLPVKRDVFAALEAVVAPDAILATNTSSLSITDLAAGLARPERVVGMHFFNPPTVLPLVEVVSGESTEPAIADAVFDLAAAWGKTPVHATSTPGFIVNRVARPYYNEPFAAYEAGIAEPATIDAVLRDGAGFRMGPFELTDLIGHDVNSAVSTSVWEAFDRDPRFTPSTAQRELVAAGRLGRKTGQGWFAYDADGKPLAQERPHATPPVSGRTLPLGVLPSGGGSLMLTRGLTAADESQLAGGHVLLVDLADTAGASAAGLAVPSDCPDGVQVEAVAVLNGAGLRVLELADVPGLVAARTVAMLVNLAADAVDAGVATATDVDLAMVKGVNYPRGPLEWGDLLGPAYVVQLLDTLAASPLPEAARRYRVSPWLRERAERGEQLR